MSQIIDCDITLVGGGIAGLWLFRRLSALGHKTLLLEAATLGGGQTIKSQGIIHGGIKYALSGNLTQASECIAGMPARWRACLSGEGDVDLTGARVLSDHQYIWTPSGLGSRVATFFASKALRGRVEPVSAGGTPQVFTDPAFKGKVYKLNEIVLDIESVIRVLVSGLERYTLKIDQAQSLRFDERGNAAVVHCVSGGEDLAIHSRRFVLCAGEGTGAILQHWGASSPQMQLRPLHMVLVKHRHPYPLYAHCISTDIVPRLTVTSHPTDDGQWVWYLGGELAESGVKHSSEEQIARASQELVKLLPWVDLSGASWATMRVNRAEPRQSQLLRPDAAFCQAVGKGLVTWPTKLALAPNLADEVIRLLRQQGVEPSGKAEPALFDHLPRPDVTKPFWSGYFD